MTVNELNLENVVRGSVSLKKFNTNKREDLDNYDYIFATKGNSYNLTEKLNSMLMDRVKVLIKDNDTVLFDCEGKLMRKPDRDNKKNYRFYIGNECMDDILFDNTTWDNPYRKLDIEIKNADFCGFDSVDSVDSKEEIAS